MDVRLMSGDRVNDLGPTRFHEDATAHPKPEFWAENARQVIERAIDRAAALLSKRPKTVNVMPITFGWGDAGLASITVYDKVGTIGTLNVGGKTTWRFDFFYGFEPKPAFEFTTKHRDTEKAKQIAVEFLHLK